MHAERDLSKLLATMEPLLRPETFVFATVKSYDPGAGLDPILIFREEEGIALILTEEEARAASMPYQFRSRMITLSVYSALDAVGFIAAVATELARHGISTNPVSAHFHDHLFVPADRADEAMMVLRDLAAAAASTLRE